MYVCVCVGLCVHVCVRQRSPRAGHNVKIGQAIYIFTLEARMGSLHVFLDAVLGASMGHVTLPCVTLRAGKEESARQLNDSVYPLPSPSLAGCAMVRGLTCGDRVHRSVSDDKRVPAPNACLLSTCNETFLFPQSTTVTLSTDAGLSPASHGPS